MSRPLAAFRGTGIELEYMIVDAETLSVRSVADELIRAEAGAYANDAPRGDFGWSNELALHLVELKNNAPSPRLERLAAGFQAEVGAVNARLAPLGARLMPTAMHPWMDPRREARLWPHQYAEIYSTYDRIFDCRRHGWANLQSMHVNLPFAGDAELERLLGAVRVVLPVLPALAASSPIAGGEVTGWADFRMQCYLTHAARVPAMMGNVVPEAVAGEAEYRAHILEPMYRAIAPLDPAEVMRDEWLNARGAIARFDRSAVEIRVIDTQECPRADLAVAAATVAATRASYEGRWSTLAEQRHFPAKRLLNVLGACIRDAERAVIDDADYLRLLGYPGARASAAELWWHLLQETLPHAGRAAAPWREPLELILTQGPLARRILNAVGRQPSRAHLEAVYRGLCECLAQDWLFRDVG
jgi:gamma-glutamyl:cysteine ligase YbdK (ATP-grasp superfamily)